MDDIRDTILEIIEGLEKLMGDLEQISSGIIISFHGFNEEVDKTRKMLQQARKICEILKKADHTRNN